MIYKNKVTIKDVAQKANVSAATVSYVINEIDIVKEETKAKVLKAIAELQYTPNLGARCLVKKESRLIGVLIPIKETYKKTVLTDNPFYQEFLSGVEYKTREYGYSTLIIGTDNEDECINLLKGKALAGLILVGLMTDNIYSLLNVIEVPIVVIDQKNNNDRFIYINSEDEKGAFLATEYLIKKGHHNIGFLSGEIEASIVHKSRFEGYKRALLKYRIPINRNFHFISAVTYEGGVCAADFVKDKINDISAIFSISDIMALGLIKGLYKQNIHVPDQLSVIGFDDIKNSKYFIPELTTVRQYIFNKGEKAVELVINNSKHTELDVKNFIVPVDIIERESVKDLNERYISDKVE